MMIYVMDLFIDLRQISPSQKHSLYKSNSTLTLAFTKATTRTALPAAPSASSSHVLRLNDSVARLRQESAKLKESKN